MDIQVMELNLMEGDIFHIQAWIWKKYDNCWDRYEFINKD